MEENNKLRSKIELQRFLTPTQIEEILDQAVQTTAANDYVGKVQIQALLDALSTNGHSFKNMFQIAGNEVIPKGTYEFLGEEDLGKPIGRCENYGCGHPIRYAEHIRHMENGIEYIVGNVCVTHLLGEHNLIEIAIALLSKISKRVDKLNKQKKILKILNILPTELFAADPDRLFTQDEAKFFRAVDKNQSNITIKKAEEIKAKWTAEKLVDLMDKVYLQRKESKMKNNKSATLSELQSWMDFLNFKQWESSSRKSNNDFISNCIDEIKVHDTLSEFRKEKLINEKKDYDRARSADPTLLIEIELKEDRLFISKMLNHAKTCDNYFITSLILKSHYFGNLTPNQKSSIRKGCKRCNSKIL